MLEHLSGILEQSIEETRRIMTDLRPSILDDFGLVVTIDWLIRRHQKLYENTVIFKKIEVDESDIPEPLKITIFRVLQEALTNIAKHSNATMVDIHLKMRNGFIEVKVEDNGVGFDTESHPRYAASGGFGLAGMKERTQLSGGSFTIDSEPGTGTKIHASWPAELDRKHRRPSLTN